MPISYGTASFLMRAILNTRQVELACDDFLMRTSHFALAELAGSNFDGLAGSGEFAHHLSICHECREEFESLIQALRSGAKLEGPLQGMV